MSSIQIETIDITHEFKQHQNGDIIYHSVVIDTDYIGWKYMVPENDDIIVCMSDISTLGVGGPCGSEYYKKCECIHNINNLYFNIGNWQNYHESPVCNSYFHDALVFPGNTKKDNIIKYLHDHIKNTKNVTSIPSLDSLFMEDNVIVTNERLLKEYDNARNDIIRHHNKFKNDFVISDNINYNLPIYFNTDTLTVENCPIKPGTDVNAPLYVDNQTLIVQNRTWW